MDRTSAPMTIGQPVIAARLALLAGLVMASLVVAGEGGVSAQTPAAQTPAAQTPSAQTPSAQTPSAQTPVAQPPPARMGEAAPAGKPAPQASPPAAALTPTATPTPVPFRPGFLDAFGRFFAGSVEGMRTGLGMAQKSLGGIGNQAGDAARGAAGAAAGLAKGAAGSTLGAAGEATNAITRLPATRLIEGRERCVELAGGAPDCRAAAERMCKAGGYRQGSSVDIQSAEKCPAHVYISGRRGDANECALESFVTRAMCQ
ncbi:MAG: hypothetical protein HY056_04805 [Proteobacteria bacterium]|nr:hypothetical protein [Pseudomonadota bacterium]